VTFRDRGILEPADEGDATVAVSYQAAHSFPDPLPVVGDNRRAPDLRIVVGDGHQRQPQAARAGSPPGRMNRDPPADLASERRGGNVGRYPAEHQESSVAFACTALDTPENAAVVFAAQDFHHRADREIAHGTLSAPGRWQPATPVDQARGRRIGVGLGKLLRGEAMLRVGFPLDVEVELRERAEAFFRSPAVPPRPCCDP
jgi:hypothetical protein